MLRLMRDHASGWLIKILLGAIVIVFMFWGVGSFRETKQSQVAAVNGEPITSQEYGDAYNRLIEQYRKFGSNLNDDMIKRLEKQALDGLIDQSLLRQEAGKLNFRVSDEELAESIQKMEVFQRDGKFDRRLYERVLNLNKLTPEGFEVSQKDGILVGKLRSFILNGIKVSDQEALEWFKWDNTSVNIEYVLFEPGKYTDIDPADEAVSEYFEANKTSYKTEPKVRARFLKFAPDVYKSKVELTDEELRYYYDENPDEFKEEKTVEARHILIKMDPEPPPEIVETKKQKALEILVMAREEGQDFAELAKEHSEGPSKDKGGLLGAFKKGAMVKPFSDKAFSMEPGDISEPVLTRFGWHIIKVEKVNEERTLSFEASKEKITRKLTDDRAKTIAYDEAEAVYDAAFDADDLAKIAEEKGLKISTTDLFTKKGPKKGVKNRSKFGSAAFDLPEMEISEVQDFGDGYYLLQVTEKIPEQLAEFEDVKAKVRRDFIKEQQEEKAKSDAAELLAALKNGGDMNTESGKFDLLSKATDFFKRNESIPDIGYEREIAKAAFKLSEESKLPESEFKGRKGYYVIQFKERKEPDQEAFDKDKEEVRKKLIQQKQFKTFDTWLSKIKEQSEIFIEPGFLN